MKRGLGVERQAFGGKIEGPAVFIHGRLDVGHKRRCMPCDCFTGSMGNGGVRGMHLLSEGACKAGEFGEFPADDRLAEINVGKDPVERPLGGVIGGGLEQWNRNVGPVLCSCSAKSILAFEMMEKCALGDTGFRTQIIHRGGIVALDADQLDGCIKDPAACGNFRFNVHGRNIPTGWYVSSSKLLRLNFFSPQRDFPVSARFRYRCFMKNFRTILACTILTASANSALSEPVKGVVELFTSQSCSSCPPADKVFGQVIRRDGVLGLAFHVDYWNYLNWKDTFSSADSTRRQYDYATSLHSSQVYTPQLIVNGKHVVSAGSPEKLLKVISDASAAPALPVAVDAALVGGRLVVNTGGGSGEANLILAIFDESETVKVERGENGGKQLTYHNAVTGLRTIGMWKGKALEVELPRKEYLTEKGQGCAVLLQRITQQGTPGEIIGAAVVSGTGS